MTFTIAVSAVAVAPRVARRPGKGARVAKGCRSASAPLRSAANDDAKTSPTFSLVTRREAVGLPATAALAAALVSVMGPPDASGTSREEEEKARDRFWSGWWETTPDRAGDEM